MSSLQLLQLTEHGRNLLSSRRRTLAVVSGALLAGGTLAYAQSSRRRRRQEKDSSTDANGHTSSIDSTSQNGVDGKVVKPRKKKNLLKSLHFLAAILLKKIGPSGTNYLLGLMLTAVLRTAIGHRLAKVQGYLFKSAFLRRVPTFTHLIIENLLLCFLQSTIYQTSKYLTGSLGLRFKKILTDLVHADYFENQVLLLVSTITLLEETIVPMLVQDPSAAMTHGCTRRASRCRHGPRMGADSSLAAAGLLSKQTKYLQYGIPTNHFRLVTISGSCKNRVGSTRGRRSQHFVGATKRMCNEEDL